MNISISETPLMSPAFLLHGAPFHGLGKRVHPNTDMQVHWPRKSAQEGPPPLSLWPPALACDLQPSHTDIQNTCL